MTTEYGRVIQSEGDLKYEIITRQLALSMGENAARKIGEAVVVSGKAESVVTNADVANSGLVLSFLAYADPERHVITEETSSPLQRFEWIKSHTGKPSYLNSGQPTYWADELDGSQNFLLGSPLWGTAVGLRENGITRAATIYLPESKRLFFASLDNGTFMEKLDGGVTEPKQVIPKLTKPSDALIMGFDISIGKTPELLPQIISAVTKAKLAERVTPRVTGCSAFDNTQVASGGYGVFMNRILKGWDIYPGEVLVREAGGASTQIGNEAVVMSNRLRADNHPKFVEVLGNVLVDFKRGRTPRQPSH